MKTILHICDWYRPLGGAEKLLFDMLALLESAGYENIVAFNEHPDQTISGRRPEHAVKGLELYTYYHPSARLQINKALKRLRRIIAYYSPDVCHIHNLQNSFITQYLLKTLPCVRSVHDPRLYCFTEWKLLPNRRICPYPLGADCIRQGCLTSGLIPKNRFDRNAFWVLRNFRVHKKMPILLLESRIQIECLLENGFAPEQIVWLPNFTPLKPRSEVEQHLNLHYRPEEQIVLFVGRASFEKGLHVLVDAYNHMKRKCKIVMITSGPLLEEVKARASARSDLIEVIPGLSYESTRLYYARSSVVVIPSVWLENFCLVGLEAYANMKPVVASKIGGIRDWLIENETGWFFEPGNPRDLANKLDEALSDSDRLALRGRNAYERACKYYNAGLFLSRLTASYEIAMDRFHSG